MHNYKERIVAQQKGKPFMLVPYVTFLPKHVQEIFDFMKSTFPERPHEKVDTLCLWVKSKASPIVEINELSEEQLKDVEAALLITGPGSINQSQVSLIETLEDKGLKVTTISSLRAYKEYEASHKDSTVLLVRAPIPNEVENLILTYISYGSLMALLVSVFRHRLFRVMTIGSYNKILYYINFLLGKGEMLISNLFKHNKREKE